MKPVPIAMLLALFLSTALAASAQQNKRNSAKPGFSSQSASSARPAAAPDAVRVLAGRYTLAASSSAPDARWVYTRARIEVRRLDARHLVLLFSCEWARWPKDACYDWWVVRQRADGLYLQDLNTGAMGMRIDPVSGALTMTTAGASEDVRTDVFTPDTATPASPILLRPCRNVRTDPGVSKSGGRCGHRDTSVAVADRSPAQASLAALDRRMQRAEASFAATVAEPAFGRPARWDFTRLRIYPPLP